MRHCGLDLRTSRCNGFTLAEVLITLGIIGVVAAMTLPTLIQNYKKQAYVTQLKKTVSSLENAFKLAMAEDGVDDLGDTQLWQLMHDQVDPGRTMNAEPEFLTELGKYIKILDVKHASTFHPQTKYLNKNGTWTTYAGIFFADGSILRYPLIRRNGSIPTSLEHVKSNGGHLYKAYTPDNYCENIIDVNGEKGPNQFGRDMFPFIIGQDGKLYPFLGKDHAILLGATAQNYTQSSNYWNPNGTMSRCSTTTESDGFGCAARIIEEGWQMNY